MRMAGWPCPGRQIQRNEMTNEGKYCTILDILVMLMAIVGQIWKTGKLVDDLFALIPHLI
jgi:hypothetical protein